jgi:hypothetical protein
MKPGRMAALAPWLGLALCAGAAVLLGARLTLVSTERADLREWQATMLRQLAAASAPPGAPARTALSPAEAPEALARIVAARDGALGMLAVSPDAPGTALAQAPAQGEATRGEITRLRDTRSTGSAAGDAQIIESDSRAAWTGWK